MKRIGMKNLLVLSFPGFFANAQNDKYYVKYIPSFNLLLPNGD